MNYLLAVWALITSLAAVGMAWLLRRAYHTKVTLVGLSEDLHKTEFEHSKLLEQQRDEARSQRDNLAAQLERQTVEVEAVIPARPKRNSKGQFTKKVTSDESSQ